MSALQRPAWAEHHREDDGGIRWSRIVEAKALPDFIGADPEMLTAEAVCL